MTPADFEICAAL